MNFKSLRNTNVSQKARNAVYGNQPNSSPTLPQRLAPSASFGPSILVGSHVLAKKKKTVYGPEVPAGLQKTRKPNGTHPLNSPKQGIMQDVNKSKLRSIKRNNSNRASKPRKQSLRNIYMAKPKVFIIG